MEEIFCPYCGEKFDELFNEAAKLTVKEQVASISMLQRVLKLGYNRAANIMCQLEAGGIVSELPEWGPRKVLLAKYNNEDDIICNV